LNDIIILIFCQTGFGDHYSSLITGFNALKDLKSLNFNPKIVIAKGHRYFPQYVDLSVIYNLESFEHDNLIQVNHQDVDEITKDYELLLFTSIQVWVKKKNDILLEYVKNHKKISSYNVRDIFGMEPDINFNIIKKEIVDKANEFSSNKKNLVGLHFRGGDDMLFTDIEFAFSHHLWADKFSMAEKVINDYPDSDIMVCSINRRICEYFSNKFTNVFFNNFELNDLPMHNLFTNDGNPENYLYNNTTKTVDEYINHSKNILAEMISFSNCHRIASFNYFPSNFVLYGVVNNNNYIEWEDKSKILLY